MISPDSPQQKPASPPAAVQTPVESLQETISLQSEPKKRRIPYWGKVAIGVVGVLIALIAAVAIFTIVATRAPQKVSDRFMGDIQSGNKEDAYSLAGESLRKETGRSKMDSIIERARPYVQGERKVVSRGIESQSGQPQTARFVYSVETDETTNYVRIGLEKGHDGWKITYFWVDGKQPETNER